MKAFLFLLALVPSVLFAQNDIYGKFTNADGSILKGSSVARGFERQLEISNLVTGSGTNTTISFTIPTGPEVAAFRNLVGSKSLLQKGEIMVTKIGRDKKTTTYKINLEGIRVEDCIDDAATSQTKLKLKASRIGFTYFDVNRTGKQVVSSKSGWDASTGTPWTGF